MANTIDWGMMNYYLIDDYVPINKDGSWDEGYLLAKEEALEQLDCLAEETEQRVKAQEQDEEQIEKYGELEDKILQKMN